MKTKDFAANYLGAFLDISELIPLNNKISLSNNKINRKIKSAKKLFELGFLTDIEFNQLQNNLKTAC